MRDNTNKYMVNANYIDGYIIECIFNDGHVSKIDFTKPLQKYALGDYAKYKELNNFKKFKINDNHLVWGKNWDIIFPNKDLYKGVIKYN